MTMINHSQRQLIIGTIGENPSEEEVIQELKGKHFFCFHWNKIVFVIVNRSTYTTKCPSFIW